MAVDEPVVIVNYDERWPEAFRREQDRLRAALGADVPIEHDLDTTLYVGNPNEGCWTQLDAARLYRFWYRPQRTSPHARGRERSRNPAAVHHRTGTLPT